MTDFKETPQGIGEPARLPERPVQLTTEQAANLSPQEEAVMFDRVFAIDPTRDLPDIKTFVGRVRKDPRFGRMASQWDYKRYKEQGQLKYSDEQLESQEWEQEDVDLAVEELRKERINRFYGDIAHQYEPAHSIQDSIVRLDQERAIADDLDAGTPVLIRGNWRLGKTSMVMSLRTHKYGDANTLFIDAMGEVSEKDESIDDFRKHFGRSKVARFIAERESAGDNMEKQWEERDKLRDEIAQSGKTPFEYLDDYLEGKDEDVFLGLDEVIGYAGEHPDRLRYLAGVKDLKHVKPAIVVHRIAEYEDELRDIFDGYKTHFIRALTEDEVAKLVRQPLEGTSIVFTDDAIQEIFGFTGGRPMEVNNLCSALMDPFSEHKNQKLVYRVEDVRGITEKESWQLRDSFRVAIDTYGRVYNRSMSEGERVIVDRLIAQGELPVPDIPAEAVQALIDTTYVRKDDQKGTYTINGELFKRVIQEKNYRT